MTDQAPTGGSLTLLRKACSAAGLESTGATPYRLAENETWRLPTNIIARIGPPGQGTVAAREVRLARWLAAHRIRTVVPIEVEQPVVVDGRPVTFWKEVPQHEPGSALDAANVLRALHCLPRPVNLDLGRLDPFVRLRDRIDAAVSLPIEDRRWLRDYQDDLSRQWAAGLHTAHAECIVHGDAWSGNIVTTPAGPLVMDLERASIGPLEWDLVSIAVRNRTTGTISFAEYELFCEAYGYDVTTWSGYGLLAAIRELRIVSYAAQHSARNPAWQAEAVHRVNCLRGRSGPRPWTWKGIL